MCQNTTVLGRAAVTPESSLNRVANGRQLTPSQETVGQRLLGHVEIPTVNNTT